MSPTTTPSRPPTPRSGRSFAPGDEHRPKSRRWRRRGVLLVAVLALVAAGCSDDDSGSTSSTTGAGGDTTTSTTGAGGDTTTSAAGGDTTYSIFSGQGNNLVAYSSEPPFESQRLYTNAAEDPNGTDINAQMCFWDDPELGRLFIAGEDTGQPDPPQGWGIFTIEGDQVGDFVPNQIGKLTPTFQGATDNAENYGCGMLSNGDLLTTDVGNQAFGPGDGQLIVWFPPFDSYEVDYCKIDVGIGTAQSIWVSADDEVYVASSRGAGPEDHPAGVYKYSGDFPTGPTPEEGCDTTDSTGAPMTTGVTRELAIPTDADTGLLFPAGLAPTPDGNLYVSSVANGVIVEYTLEGEFVRTILAPPADEVLDEDSYSTGTPLGLGTGPDGTLYLADIGVVDVTDADGNRSIGPGDNNGHVRRIVFVDGEPQPPEIMDSNLGFPDGIGIFIP